MQLTNDLETWYVALSMQSSIKVVQIMTLGWPWSI